MSSSVLYLRIRIQGPFQQGKRETVFLPSYDVFFCGFSIEEYTILLENIYPTEKHDPESEERIMFSVREKSSRIKQKIMISVNENAVF